MVREIVLKVWGREGGKVCIGVGIVGIDGKREIGVLGFM